MPPDSIERKTKRDSFRANLNKNVFIIMRYGERKEFKEIERAIKDTLQAYGLTGILARDEKFHEVSNTIIRFVSIY